jgi:hypothetical protein
MLRLQNRGIAGICRGTLFFFSMFVPQFPIELLASITAWFRPKADRIIIYRVQYREAMEYLAHIAKGRFVEARVLAMQGEYANAQVMTTRYREQKNRSREVSTKVISKADDLHRFYKADIFFSIRVRVYIMCIPD